MKKRQTSSQLSFIARFSWILTTLIASGLVVFFWWSSYMIVDDHIVQPVKQDCCAIPSDYPVEWSSE